MHKALVVFLFLALVGAGSYLMVGAYNNVFEKVPADSAFAQDQAGTPGEQVEGSIPASGSGGVSPVSSTATAGLTMAAVALHAKPSDCWITVSGKVYGVTAYLNRHPAGAEAITPYCGKDATIAFATKGGSGNHSSVARNLLSGYYIGDLGSVQSAAVSSGTAAGNNPATGSTQTALFEGQGSIPAVLPARQSQPALQAQPAVGGVSMTSSEVAKHSSSADCWIVITGNVYDVTGFLRAHPGGAGAISPYCGRDASAAFNGQHPSSYLSSLAGYLLGPLGGQTVSAPSQQPSSQPAVANPSRPSSDDRGWEREDEEEDD